MTQKDLLHEILKLHLIDYNQFRLSEVYQVAEGPMSFHYPDNHHIRDKIRELLQRLWKEDKVLDFYNMKGIYQWRKRG